jgi:hypothetical protein
MRTLLWLPALFVIAVPARADEKAEARTVLDKVIRAAGGQERLSRLQGVTWKGQGTVHVNEQKIAVRDERSAREPDRWRWLLNAETDGQTIKLLLVANKEKGWLQVNDREVGDLPPDLHHPLQNAARVVRLVERPDLLLDRAYTLAPLGELRIDDRDAVGIKATAKGHPDLDLFFDRKTYLPIRAEIRLKEKKDSDDVQYRFSFAGHKKFGDVMHFTKVVFRREDVDHVELELEEVKVHDTLDDSTFEKP